MAAGANVNAKDSEDFTPVLRASRIGHADICAALINAGADLNVRENLFGRTLLSSAIFHGHVSLLEMFLNAGVDVDIKDKSEKHRFMLQQRRDILKFVKSLLTRVPI